MKTDYSKLASTYDKRYESSPMLGVEQTLHDIILQNKFKSVLEIGCGMGHWLDKLVHKTSICCGVDPSMKMLRKNSPANQSFFCINGVAEHVPFPDGSFDFIFCVNAIHHFADLDLFLNEANRILRDQGQLAIFGMNPRDPDMQYYQYKYFPSVYERDIARFKDLSIIEDKLRDKGFKHISQFVVEKIKSEHIGKSVFEDPFLDKRSTSQLAMLSDEQYDQGIENINQAINQAEASGENITFLSVIPMHMLIAEK
ncbi:MAG: class I SAM-dependent methyltransferase [Anaerolineaceae bacterium]|nr:class I SAM-dependent methyltransferase [Anaerolineaceae bacterium]